MIKLTTDEAYERARRRGLFDGDLDAFQSVDGGAQIAGSAAFAERRAPPRGARRLPERVPPRDRGGLGRPARADARRSRIPRPSSRRCRPARTHGRRRASRARCSRSPGGSRRQKALEVGLEAVAEAGDVTLLVAGDGARARRARGSARRSSSSATASAFSARSRARECSSCSARADASLLSSAWENFPHTVVESLAVGTPVIATRRRRRRRGRDGRRERPARAGPATRRRSPPRSAASSPSAGCASGSRRPRRRRSPVTRRDAIHGRIEAVLVEAAG